MDNIEPGEPWTFADGFKKYMEMSWGEFVNQCDFDTFLIIDEVQKIYKPEDKDESHHGGDIFWNAFKYIKQSTRLHIVAFASYGHYGAYTTRGNHAVMDISPTNDLKENNKWGFNDVCFTEEEYSNYFHQFCKVCLKKLENEHIQYLFNYVRGTTNLHTGLVAFIMNEIRGRFLKRETLTFEDVFMYLKSNDFNCHLKGIRATPQVPDMSEEEMRIADTVLFKKGGYTIQSQKIPYNSRIIKTNILVSTKCLDNPSLSILDFPAPLLRTTYLQDRFGSVLRPKSPPKTFKDFINAVFTKMNPKVLQKSKGIGTDGRLLERVWQMEFYRSSMQVLPADIFASVDVGAVYRSKGYLDFYVNDKRNWAIELLRDGNRLEHQRRFETHGIYAPIKKIAKEWAIVDIRNCSMKLPEQVERGTNDIYVLCAENFDSVRLAYPDGTENVVRLLGEEENLLGYDISDFLDDPMEVEI